jgi:hypothetical protein
MIIDDLDIKGVAVLEAKADAPLVVDADTPLTEPIVLQRFQTIRRRPTQILKASGCIQLRQAHVGALLNFGRETARLAGYIEMLRFVIGKRPNHELIINDMFISVNVDALSPLEALNKLFEWKKKAK